VTFGRTIALVTDFALAERAALADLLTELGPQAPTLCEGWTTRDLAAHLVLRERRPDASAGIVIKKLAGRTGRVQREIASRDWPGLVDTVRRRPWWSPVSNPLLDEVTNATEFFVHHEDVRRAQPGWQPRTLPAEQEAALWKRVRGLARLVLRKTPAKIILVAPRHGEATAGKGGPEVRLSGSPGELLLFLMGRQDHARIDLTGPPEITDRMRHARYGI
jgi:uncharacterized protein (TIGR03085 family)